MSGHSKWSQIKRQKGLNDLKKGQIYTKIAKQIVMTTKQGGGDPNTNFSLRMAINKAKSVNMPSDSVEKAIKKGLGEDKNANLIENVTYEAYGINGATFLIDALTDNRNRTAADVRMIVEKNGGRIVESGSISWQYDILGLITLTSQTEEEKQAEIHRKWNDTTTIRKVPTGLSVIEEFELQCIDIAGVKDFISEKEGEVYTISIYTQMDKLDAVRKSIEFLGYDVEQAEIIKKAQTEISLEENDIERNQKLMDAIEEYDDVDTIWTNVTNL